MPNNAEQTDSASDRRPGIDPTPEQISKRAARIRAGWSRAERLRRLAGITDEADTDDEAA